MHIPDAMLHGRICPVTAIIASISIAAAIWAVLKEKERPAAGRFGAVTALIFAGQMMNFPIMSGVSGHLVGGVLAARLLGVPLGILAMSLVIAIQCFFFGDGGVSALGANILNMAILSLVAGDRMRVFLSARLNQNWAAAIASWLSVMVGALAVTAELGWNILFPMLGVHALIGMGEALITCAVLVLLKRFKSAAVPMAATALVLCLSPFASASPDGLEWVAQKWLHLTMQNPSS